MRDLLQRTLFLILAIFSASLIGCFRQTPQPSIEEPVPRVETSPAVTKVQAGEASFYGEEFHNKRTASGEIFDSTRMTAAHRTLPFGTKIRVTNTENGKVALLRVNDRGPFAKGRVLDVSRQAAKELGFHQDGVTNVKIEVLASPQDEQVQDSAETPYSDTRKR